MQSKANRNGIYYIRNPRNNDKMPLLEYIATCKAYFEPTSAWKDIFALVTKQILDKDGGAGNNQTSHRGEIDYDEPDLKCLACTPFYELSSNIFMP